MRGGFPDIGGTVEAESESVDDGLGDALGEVPDGVAVVPEVEVPGGLEGDGEDAPEDDPEADGEGDGEVVAA